MPNVEEIVAKYAGLVQDPNAWFAPNIPSDVLCRAFKHCEHLISDDDVLLVVDDVLKGKLWGKDENFILLTKDRIIGRGWAGNCTINLMEITDVEVEDNGGGVFLFFLNKNYEGGENQCFGFWKMSRHFCIQFRELLNDLVKMNAAGLATNPLPCSQECRGCGAQVRYGFECEYCGRPI